jgi:hydrogenase maturation protein HypF
MTWNIHIQGQVQGVGFRPFVWRTALDRGLKGWVANGLQGVWIKINATAAEAIDFQEFILKNIPETAHITAAALTADEDDTFFDQFTIIESHSDGLAVLHLTPDMALCAHCRSEIHEVVNRRYQYPFTTCTVCGPRYSIITGLPYDRPLTTMQAFEMCPTCQEEYADPANRRFYAQTNSCPDCGIHMKFIGGGLPLSEAAQGSLSSVQIIEKVVSLWQTGHIVAIKGTGGFLLTCDATNAQAIAHLRTRKHRPSKPFALMYPDMATLQGDATVTDAALRLLQSPSAPIVLLDLLDASRSGLDRDGIAPRLHKIGAMLPNAPLFELLLHDFGKPIVATSGNISHAPLVYDDATAIKDLSGIADLILTHNRPVVVPQDDSVLALRTSEASVVIRRARGLAPSLIQTGLEVPNITVLALGAEMKSTFTLAHLGNVNVSQYIGDLSGFDVQERYKLVLNHLTGLFQATPTVVISDLHPGYFTTQLGQELAEQWQVPWIKVQHHKAHFAAVLAENNLLRSDESVLGIIWDGTGWGEDGQIWGGEFFKYHYPSSPQDRFTRCAHFDYFPVILGDKMAVEPRLSALAICHELYTAEPWLKGQFTDKEWQLYPKIAANSPIKTASVGRIFDAVAALLGWADKVSYEGEAAMLLEDKARKYAQQYGYHLTSDYCNEVLLTNSIRTQKLFQNMVQDLDEGYDKSYIAFKFHWSLVKIIAAIANDCKIKKIAFSGGVFQNTLLLDLITEQLTPNYQLYFHQQLSPNDENISFGQWAYALATNQF